MTGFGTKAQQSQRTNVTKMSREHSEVTKMSRPFFVTGQTRDVVVTLLESTRECRQVGF